MAESPLGYSGGTRFTIRLRHEGETPGKTIGRFRFSVTREQDAARNVKLPTRVERVLAVPAGRRTENQRKVLDDYYRGIAPMLTPKKQRLSELLAFWKQLTSPNSLVMKELDKPRTSHVFVKGSFLNPGQEVQPGVPSVLHPLPESETPPNRLTLARWLVSPENPLVGRVTMNRLWADHFGRALVKTPENLGDPGRTSDPSGASGLARHRVRGAEMVHESHAPLDGHFGNLPAGPPGWKTPCGKTTPPTSSTPEGPAFGWMLK